MPVATMARSRGAEEEERLLSVDLDREKGHPIVNPQVEDKGTWRNLPHKKQLLLLSLCRLSTPLSNACLLPYLYHLIKSIISDPTHPYASQHIARLTGILVAAYPLGQVVTSLLWGRLSDNYGRKPAILLGLVISVISNVAFGFSQSIGTLLFWRVLAGMANGMVGVMRTMTAEIVKDKRHQTRAFLAPPVVFNSGRVAALAVGGCLADPVLNLPSLFGPSGLLNFSENPDGVSWALRFPYALPAIFNGVVLSVCLLLASLHLKETLPAKVKRRNLGVAFGKSVSGFIREKMLRKHKSAYTVVDMEDSEVDSPWSGPPISTHTNGLAIPQPAKGIWTRHLLKTLLAFGLLPLHNATFLHIFPVFLSMPSVTMIKPTAFYFVGGLGLSSPTVGLFLASFGICGILLQLFIYPRIHDRLGTLGALRLSGAIFPFAYIFAPFLSLVSQNASAKWSGMAVVLISQVFARTMAFPSSVVLLTNASPRKSSLGTVHGAGNTASAFASTVGPVIGGLFLARGIEKGVVGTVWWFWLTIIAVLSLIWSFFLDQGENEHIEAGAEDS